MANLRYWLVRLDLELEIEATVDWKWVKSTSGTIEICFDEDRLFDGIGNPINELSADDLDVYDVSTAIEYQIREGRHSDQHAFEGDYEATISFFVFTLPTFSLKETT